MRRFNGQSTYAVDFIHTTPLNCKQTDCNQKGSMLPLPDSLLERSFYSQLEINSTSSSNQAPQPDFPFVYPSPAFFLEGFPPPPPPPPGPPINSRLDAANLEPIQLNLNTTTNNNSKRVARKDRHSKINTAAGLRDRRMRLSLDVARKFFDLQDMLGFDKASKTVQWLLTKSKTAIKEITGGSRSTNSDNRTTGSQDNNTDWAESDCEDGSTVSDYKQKAVSEEKKQKVKKSSVKAARKSNVHQAVDKESRAKARERARERTKEKNRLRWVTITSSIAVESSGEGSGSGSHGHANYTSTNNLVDDMEKGSSSAVHRQKHALTEQSQLYDHFPVDGDGSTSMPLYDYTVHEFEGNYNNFSLYQGQWGMEGLQFAVGMQYHSRPW